MNSKKMGAHSFLGIRNLNATRARKFKTGLRVIVLSRQAMIKTPISTTGNLPCAGRLPGKVEPNYRVELRAAKGLELRASNPEGLKIVQHHRCPRGSSRATSVLNKRQEKLRSSISCQPRKKAISTSEQRRQGVHLHRFAQGIGKSGRSATPIASNAPKDSSLNRVRAPGGCRQYT